MLHIIYNYSNLVESRPKMVRMPIFGNAYFDHNSVILEPVGMKIFQGSSEDYYLLISDEKSKSWCLFISFDFLWEKGVMSTTRHWWFRASKPNIKVGSLGGILAQLLSWNQVFLIFRGHPLNDYCRVIFNMHEHLYTNHCHGLQFTWLLGSNSPKLNSGKRDSSNV